jgi:hypothetical protein
MSRTPWSKLEEDAPKDVREVRPPDYGKPLADRMGMGGLMGGVVVDLAGLLVGRDALLQILPDIDSGRQLQTLIQMRELPGPVKGGGYDLIAAVKQWFQYKLLQKDDSAREEQSSKERYWAARALKEEIEAEAVAGRYVPLLDMLQAWQDCFAAVANRIDAVPGRVAAELAGVADASIVRKRLLEELRAARAEAAQTIAGWEERLAAAVSRQEADESAAAEDAGSVGGSE